MNKELKPFDRIIIKFGETWRCSFFSHYDGEEAVNINGIHFPVGEYLTFEGNEHLVGTNLEPKPQKWRAEKGKDYWFIASDMVVCIDREEYKDYDTNRYLAGNYFQTIEEAKEVAEKFKNLLSDGQRTI